MEVLPLEGQVELGAIFICFELSLKLYFELKKSLMHGEAPMG